MNMDTISLRWLHKVNPLTKRKRASKEKRAHSPSQVLGVFVNDQPLESWLETIAASRGVKSLGDVFLAEHHVLEFAKGQWLASCEFSGFITLLACGCGHWECSSIGVQTTVSDNWVHWRFDLTPIYLTRFGELPEFWFDRQAYCQMVSQFEF
ncbi:hypothetical protein Sden_1581 [Shewanella denitrificans OS217]|jgi:hypothetical protein|uniref:Uncharacterized protein n=1 Tax=Shewanella denitrificans (strain OS217 / ATCC BAA-1090 / DSM 15013) TaxID=318161 RepID=Q12NW1_SHEDO|nr:hypothetical protein [Shewanella denitrificans]ABE54865.1 hypothetical protein Sden_1581 [Shewanella denitrificans OS217]